MWHSTNILLSAKKWPKKGVSAFKTKIRKIFINILVNLTQKWCVRSAYNDFFKIYITTKLSQRKALLQQGFTMHVNLEIPQSRKQ